MARHRIVTVGDVDGEIGRVITRAGHNGKQPTCIVPHNNGDTELACCRGSAADGAVLAI